MICNFSVAWVVYILLGLGLGFRILEFRVDNNDDNNIKFNHVNNYHKSNSMIYIYIYIFIYLDDITNAKLFAIYNT